MFSKFFINRPIFATVISLVIVLAGLVSMQALPVEQYPDIVPTEIQISATYPGATAEVLADTVAAPIEQEVNGVKNMIYMYSSATSSGYLTIGVVFDIGTDPDQATIDVNNKVQAATAKLPAEVVKQGVTVKQKSNSILQIVTMRSTSDRYDTVYVSNYALLNVLDEIKRIRGVGDASLFASQDYSMRIWLSPDKLADYNLTPYRNRTPSLPPASSASSRWANISLIPTASTPRAVWSMLRSSAISFLKATTTAAPCFV